MRERIKKRRCEGKEGKERIKMRLEERKRRER